MSGNNPRRQRAYKATDKIYDKAMRRAKKEGGKIANLVENVLIAYAYGLDITATNDTMSGGGYDVSSEEFSKIAPDFGKFLRKNK